jgi:hypothetical protein
MPVHDVNMERVAAGLFDIPDLLGQPAEVRGKQTRGDHYFLQNNLHCHCELRFLERGNLEKLDRHGSPSAASR